MREDSLGNLVLDDGTVVPENMRQKAEVYSRVVGFLRPVEQWNDGSSRSLRIGRRSRDNTSN